MEDGVRGFENTDDVDNNRWLRLYQSAIEHDLNTNKSVMIIVISRGRTMHDE